MFMSARKKNVRQHGWFKFAIPDLDTNESTIDLSFLNEDIAGSNGNVKIENGHFVDGNEERIKFFGTNLTFNSLFPNKDTAEKFATRVSKLGYNIVRFHHLDMQSAPNGIWTEGMEDFHKGQLKKMDYLIYQLKQKGVYINLNLHVSRTYPGAEYENIGDFNFGKGIDNFYRPYIKLQKRYARKLLMHENSFTGNTYAEEPAVAFVEINNENSLLSNWHLLPEMKSRHKNALHKQWKRWLSSQPKYSSKKSLYKIIQHYEQESSAQEKKMMWEFLKDTEVSYFREMIDYVKNNLGVNALVSGTQASYSGVGGVYREAQLSDYVDMHAYWQHPDFPGDDWSDTNWLIDNSAMVSDKNGGTISRFALHKVRNMPLTVSEYDHPAPNFFVAEMYPMLNSVASFQDWDGIYHFTFNGPYGEGQFDDFFSSSGHPLKQIYLPIGAAMFRMNGVNKGENPVRLQIPEDEVLNQLIESGHTMQLHESNMNDVWKNVGAPKALPLMHPMEVKIGGENLKLSQSVEKPNGALKSNNQKLVWNNGDSTEATFSVNSTDVKAAVGYIGGKSFELDNVTIDMDKTDSNWASIAMASLDNQPIPKSSTMLLVAAGKVKNTNMSWNKDYTSVGDQWGEAPTRAEGIPAKISFRDMDPFQVFVLDPSGERQNEITVNSDGGKKTLNIGAQHQTLWYLIERN